MTETSVLWNQAKPLPRHVRNRLLWNIQQYYKKHNEGKQRLPTSFLTRAQQYKDAFVSQLDEALSRTIHLLRARQIDVRYIRTTRELQQFLETYVQEHNIRYAVKSKSMLAEENAVRQTLEQCNVEVTETDLGALIVQWRGERPFHIVTPAMHLRYTDVASLFQQKVGTSPETPVPQLVRIARHWLRKRFAQADLAIVSANFYAAQEGALVFVENEGNIRLCLTVPRHLIILVGIDKGIPSVAHLSVFLQVLATYGTGQRLTAYNTVWFRPLSHQKVTVLFLDGGRRTLWQNPHLRKVFRCIRCGACLYICPVYQEIGGFGYPHAYSGPIGIVLGMHVGTSPERQRLPWLCSLCTACTQICPMGIPLHKMIRTHRSTTLSRWEKILWRAWAWLEQTRWRHTLPQTLKRILLKILTRIAWHNQKEAPRPAPEPFSRYYQRVLASTPTQHANL